MLPYYIKINSQLTLYNHYTTDIVPFYSAQLCKLQKRVNSTCSRKW